MRRPGISPSCSRVFPPRGSKRRVAQSPRVARRLCRAQQQWHAFGRQKGWTISSRLVRCVQATRMCIQRRLRRLPAGTNLSSRFPGRTPNACHGSPHFVQHKMIFRWSCLHRILFDKGRMLSSSRIQTSVFWLLICVAVRLHGATPWIFRGSCFQWILSRLHGKS